MGKRRRTDMEKITLEEIEKCIEELLKEMKEIECKIKSTDEPKENKKLRRKITLNFEKYIEKMLNKKKEMESKIEETDDSEEKTKLTKEKNEFVETLRQEMKDEMDRCEEFLLRNNVMIKSFAK